MLVPLPFSRPYESTYVDIPRDSDKEDALIKTLARCTKVMSHVYNFQAHSIKHINPTAHETDEFIIPPVIPREETSNSGILLTSLSLHESCELLEKGEEGNFDLQSKAKSRYINMTGDALSVKNYKSLKMKTTQKLTTIGNEGLVDTLIAAHDRITIQHGYF